MATYFCPTCNQPAAFPALTIARGCADVAECTNGNCAARGWFITQDAGFVRDQIDRDRQGVINNKLPSAYMRAIGLASAIYGLATHNKAINYPALENAIAAQQGAAYVPATVIQAGPQQFNRSFDRPKTTGPGSKLLQDPRVGVMTIPMQVGQDTHLYIAFRGSRGDSGRLNPQGAGWDGSTNVDWQANAFNQQITVPWGPTRHGAATKVHAGFAKMFQSVSQQIAQEVSNWPNATVIVTGHSLGAALSVLCAHYLETQVPNCKPFCFPFNTPRVGNAAFADEFYTTIASSVAQLPPDTNGPFFRCVNTTRSNDKVSSGGEKAFTEPMTKSQRRLLSATGYDPVVTGTVSVLVKAAAIGLKQKDDTALYYQTPNVWERHGSNFLTSHDYTHMQESILGTAVFKK